MDLFYGLGLGLEQLSQVVLVLYLVLSSMVFCGLGPGLEQLGLNVVFGAEFYGLLWTCCWSRTAQFQCRSCSWR